MSIYDSLNEQQREAVFHTEGPLLILAGAGSGKTRVLTHRSRLSDRRGGSQSLEYTVAITFTNKAAGEMRERVDQTRGVPGRSNVWVSTVRFSMCVRILQAERSSLIGYDRNFTIYDADDQKTLMKDVCRPLGIDTQSL